MININVIIPCLGDVLRFACEEDSLTDHLMAKVQKTLLYRGFSEGGDSYFGNKRHSWLCHIESRKMLSHNMTLVESGLIDGSSIVVL